MVKLIGLTGMHPALDISDMFDEKDPEPDFIVDFREQTTWKSDTEDEISKSLCEKNQVSNWIKAVTESRVVRKNGKREGGRRLKYCRGAELYLPNPFSFSHFLSLQMLPYICLKVVEDRINDAFGKNESWLTHTLGILFFSALEWNKVEGGLKLGLLVETQSHGMTSNYHLFEDMMKQPSNLTLPGGKPDFCFILDNESKVGYQVVLQTCEVKPCVKDSELDRAYCRVLASVSLSYMLRIFKLTCIAPEEKRHEVGDAMQVEEAKADGDSSKSGFNSKRRVRKSTRKSKSSTRNNNSYRKSPRRVSNTASSSTQKRNAPPVSSKSPVSLNIEDFKRLHVPFINVVADVVKVYTIWYDHENKCFVESTIHTFSLKENENVKRFAYYLLKSVSLLQEAAQYFGRLSTVPQDVLAKGEYAVRSFAKSSDRSGKKSKKSDSDDANNSAAKPPGDVASLQVISNSSSFNLFEVTPHFVSVMEKDGSSNTNLRYLSGWMHVSESPSLVQVFIRVAEIHRVEYEVEALKRVAEIDPTLVECGAVPKCLNHFRVPDTEYGCVVTPMVNGLTLGCLRTSIDEALRIRTALVDIIRRLHTVGVVHRDIKPSNVLVRNASDNLSHVCLIDYDCADVCPDGNFLGKGSVGTRGYMPTPVANFRDGDAAYDMREMDWEALKITLRVVCSRCGFSERETESVVSGVPNPYSVSHRGMKKVKRNV